MNLSNFLSFLYILVLNLFFIVFNAIILQNLVKAFEVETKFTHFKSLANLSEIQLFSIIKLMFDKGFLDEPLALLKKSLKKEDRENNLLSALLFFYLGQIYYRQNDFNASIHFLRKSLNILPGFNDARYLLIQIYAKRKLFSKLSTKSYNKFLSFQVESNELKYLVKNLQISG